MPIALCGFNDGPGISGREMLSLNGPTLIVRIGFDPGYDYLNPNVLPAIPGADHHALVDTGAGGCCIDSAVALALNLPIIDQAVCSGISGPRIVNMHMAQIYVPTLQFTFVGAFAGVDLIAGGQPHAVLIGRDFLRHFKMRYHGDNGTVEIEGPIALAP